MLSIQEKKEISKIFVAQIFLELLAIIFDTFIFEHPVCIEKIKVKFSQIFMTLISTLKEENKIILTEMVPG